MCPSKKSLFLLSRLGISGGKKVICLLWLFSCTVSCFASGANNRWDGLEEMGTAGKEGTRGPWEGVCSSSAAFKQQQYSYWVLCTQWHRLVFEMLAQFACKDQLWPQNIWTCFFRRLLNQTRDMQRKRFLPTQPASPAQQHFTSNCLQKKENSSWATAQKGLGFPGTSLCTHTEHVGGR